VALTALSAGCKGEPAAPAPESKATTTSSAAPGDESPLTISKRLARSKPGGTQPLDREIEKLEQAVDKSPEKSDAWVLLGRAWVRKAREASDPGFYLNAKACADVALDLAPDNRAAKNLIGIMLLNQHKFDDARDLAEQMLRKAPQDMMALGTLSDANLEVGRYPEATQAAQRMMDLKPNLPSYIRVSYLEWLRGDIKGALESAHGAADAGRDPKDPEPRCWALVQAAMIFWHQGDYPGTDAGAQLALKECADYPPALVVRGRVALAGGEHPRAAELLAQSLKASPLAETAWLLGDARAAAGDSKGADEAYAHVVKDGRVADLRTLALFYATKDRDHDEAVRLAETERKVRDDIYTEDALAWALYRAGKLPEARAASDKANALGTKDARLIYHAGAIKIAAGDKPGGEKLVKAALALNPKFDWTGSAEAERLVAGK
jgi:tetratricopeptide (TPR) repeat protein